MKVTIKRRITNEVIIEGEYESIKDALQKNRGADMRGADLGGAYLRGADLRGANLGDADMCDADMRDADLGGAYLCDADMRDADLGGAYLRGADLRGANLGDADMCDADMRDADLGGAYLGGADMRGANLGGVKGQISWLKAYTLRDYIKEYGMETDGAYFFAYKGVTEKLESPTQNAKLEYKIGTTVEVDEGNPDVWTDCGHGINLCPSVRLAKEWGPRVVKIKVHMGDMVCLPISRDKFRVKRCEVIGEVE